MSELLIAALFCFGGLAILLKSANMMIDGGISIAHRLRLSQMLIGLTLLAFGTSAPEMVVNFLAAYRGQGSIVTGNIVGSNLANLALGIGCAAVISPLVFSVKNTRVDFPLGIIGILFFFIVSAILQLNHYFIGIVMLAVFLLYLWQAWQSDAFAEEEEHIDLSMPKAIIFVCIGLVGLFIGGRFTVDGAVDIARLLNIRETVIALTVVAIGTSAPEIITCIQAARRRHANIAIGNIAGSQIFNGLWVLGGSSIIAHIKYDPIIYQDLAVLVAITLFVILAAKAFNKYSRLCGGILIATYSLYIVYIVGREIML